VSLVGWASFLFMIGRWRRPSPTTFTSLGKASSPSKPKTMD